MSSPFPLIKKAVQEAHSIELTYSGSRIYTFNVVPFGERGTYLNTELVSEILDGFAASLASYPSFDYLVAPEPGGHIWGLALAQRVQKPLNILRAAPSYLPGEREVRRKTGYYQHNLYFNHIRAGDKVVIIDDVISTGSTLDTIISTMKDAGALVLGAELIYAKTTDYLLLSTKYDVPIHALVYNTAI